MSSRHADAPGEQLRRLKQGNGVAVITLPNGHRILADPREGSDGKARLARINQSSAFCWSRILPTRALDRYLKVANGNISTARTRSACPGWPSRLTDIGGDH